MFYPQMTIRKKDHLRLECNISPSPSPATIQWIRNVNACLISESGNCYTFIYKK